ncbi:MAG: LOG family protein, partial [Acidimicrobiales bacterium]
ELAEVTTWAQLGIHRRPVAVLDVTGYWRPLADLLDRAVTEGYVTEASRRLVLWVDRVADLLGALAAYAPPPAEGELTRDEM